MLIYKCSRCGKVYYFNSMPEVDDTRCTNCKGQLIWIDEIKSSGQGKRCQKENKKKKLDWGPVLRVARGLNTAWEVAGILRGTIKSVEGKDLTKGDLVHVAVPLVVEPILERLETRQKEKRSFPLPKTEITTSTQDARVHKIVELVLAQQKLRQSKGPSPETEDTIREEKPLVKKQIPSERKPLPSRASVERRDLEASLWLKIFCHYPVILILGAKGTGKSCLAFYLVELMRYRGPCYAYRFPEEGKDLLPPWLGILEEIDDAPVGSIVLIDEAYLSFFSRDSQSRENKEITRIINLSRQKKLTLIFVAHESRHLEKNILGASDCLIIKKPAPLQVQLDRSVLRTYLLRAEKVFSGKDASSAKRLAYVAFSPSGFEGTLENGKASFWSEKLSHVFALGHPGTTRKQAQELSKEEKKERAYELYKHHHSFGEISAQLSIGKTTAYRWVKEQRKKERGQK